MTKRGWCTRLTPWLIFSNMNTIIVYVICKILSTTCYVWVYSSHIVFNSTIKYSTVGLIQTAELPVAVLVKNRITEQEEVLLKFPVPFPVQTIAKISWGLPTTTHHPSDVNEHEFTQSLHLYTYTKVGSTLGLVFLVYTMDIVKKKKNHLLC